MQKFYCIQEEELVSAESSDGKTTFPLLSTVA